MLITSRLKLSLHKHTGHLRPHEYTSYAPLFLLLIFVGIALTVRTVNAGTPGPASGYIGLSGTVPGNAPTEAATITSPTNQEQFSSTPIQVTGSCPTSTLLEVFSNDIFVGSTSCSSSGTYSVNVDLLIGTNVLVVTDYNALDEAGPSSSPVTVYYNVASTSPQAISSLNLSGDQLFISTDAVYRGTFPGQQLSVPIEITGGVPPYAINTEWGDSTNQLISRSNDSSFNVSHTYNKPGTYQLSIQATDSANHAAYLTVAVIVNGQAAVSSSLTPTNSSKNQILILWPLYAMVATTVVSFWLGERREKRVLIHPKLTLHA